LSKIDRGGELVQIAFDLLAPVSTVATRIARPLRTLEPGLSQHVRNGQRHWTRGDRLADNRSH
jgi:hypothetical protein